MKPRDELPSIDLDALEQVEGAFFSISFGCGGFPFAIPFMSAYAPEMVMPTAYAPDPYSYYGYGFGPAAPWDFGFRIASGPANGPSPPKGMGTNYAGGYHGGSPGGAPGRRTV